MSWRARESERESTCYLKVAGTAESAKRARQGFRPTFRRCASKEKGRRSRREEIGLGENRGGEEKEEKEGKGEEVEGC